MARPLVLIVGGGFAGVEAARKLVRSEVTDVLLVDVANFTLFTPMLPEVATGDIEARHILVPHRDILPPRYFRQGKLLGFDRDAGTAVVETKMMPRRDEILFDHAIFAPGGVTNFFGVKGAGKYALTFKTIGDAILLRNRMLGLLERASVETSSEGRAGLCRIVIVGAGYSGVELAAALADFFHGARRQYPELADYLGVTLVEMRDRVTPMLPERLQDVCRRKLERSGVDLRLRTEVEEVAPEAVRFSGGETLSTLTTVWAAGTKPTEELAQWDLPLDRKGRIQVDRFLRADGIENIWAAGDAASVPLEQGEFAPPTAQHAARQGRRAAENVLAVLGGMRPSPMPTGPRGSSSRSVTVAAPGPSWASWSGDSPLGGYGEPTTSSSCRPGFGDRG
jgi:NADH dehydrogenase